jgi:outer membrane protein TolC
VTLLTAQQAYQQARIACVRAVSSRFTDTVTLFQALGGGWWNRSDPATAAAPAAGEHGPGRRDRDSRLAGR